ncbi:hypothetical protein BDZ94DRAFT_644852 [Collybia nuda]|uniref:Uncharacterized protein n=1 Tax=Collybia nuda TaxID=64659 RepID=A0A9P5Y5D0_9AGAR|nr:hypothetical protein BDZ94DRAFT_644852 [Collybia nuda]
MPFFSSNFFSFSCSMYVLTSAKTSGVTLDNISAGMRLMISRRLDFVIRWYASTGRGRRVLFDDCFTIFIKADDFGII